MHSMEEKKLLIEVNSMKGIDREIYFSRRKNCSLFLEFTIIFGFFLLIGSCKAFSTTFSSSQSGDDGTCRTKVCNQIATSFLSKMNPGVDPCDDFYQYACGNFINNTEMQEYETQIGSYSALAYEIRKQLNQSLNTISRENNKKPLTLMKIFYQSCMNIEQTEKIGLSEISNKIKSVGGWPVVDGDSWNETDFDWLNVTRRLQKFGYKSNFFYTIDTRPIRTDTSYKYVLTFDKPSFYIDSTYLKDSENYTIDEAYLKYITDTAKAFGAKINCKNNEMLDVLNFMKNLTKISMMSQEFASFSELKQYIPNVPWLPYIDAQMPENSTIREDTLIFVDIGSLSELESLLARTPKRTLANYIMTEVVISAVPFLNNEVREFKLAFDGTVKGITKHTERWQECIEHMNNKLPIAVSYIYVHEHFNRETQLSQDVHDIFLHLKEQFIDMIQKNEWMDYESKVYALAKLATMSLRIGYPNELLDDDKIEEYYADLELSEDSYLGIVSRLEKFNKIKSIAELGKPYNKKDWHKFATKATTVNAYYIVMNNDIYIPAGVLHDAFLNRDLPKYFIYGTIGMILGHEMSHGYDPVAINYDKDAENKRWLTNQSKLIYAQRTKCIADQYFEYIVKEVGLKIDGESTKEENFADVVGIAIAYSAYKEWIKKYGEEKKLSGLNRTPEQLFWLSNANLWCTKYRPLALKNNIVTKAKHAPVESRIDLPLKHNPEFAKDFNCELGSNMNPSKKCIVF